MMELYLLIKKNTNIFHYSFFIIHRLYIKVIKVWSAQSVRVWRLKLSIQEWLKMAKVSEEEENANIVSIDSRPLKERASLNW